ncbi:hypothetical protein IPA_02315 [Ignicoccus pacificus DSM 13166]|uniref:Probable membrane transporter protein n=1 Tax=Ignicoccus pacificus DSM 13166 TaxID=940294 RepID=A0A977PKN7_9CREN|nr:hypothetical protein IPA_02315 [Ignicoccus pacificus DSM 13166]
MLWIEGALAGLLSGLVAALFGIGGGAVAIPIMIFLLGIPPSYAVGTNSVIIIASTSLSALFHMRQGTLRKEGIYLGIGGAIGSLIGNWLFFLAAKSGLMEKVLAILFILVAIMMLLSPRGRKKEVPPKDKLFLSGLALGVFAGLAGMSGGIFINPLLVLLFDLDIKLAIGLSVAAIPITSLVSAIPKVMWGYVLWPVAISFIPGIIIGSRIGAKLMKRWSSKVLRKLFSILMILLGLKLWFK